MECIQEKRGAMEVMQVFRVIESRNRFLARVCEELCVETSSVILGKAVQLL